MNDFIITSLQSWDSTFGGNAKDIACELSLQNRVLYVNPAVTKNKERKKTFLRNIHKNLWVLDCALPLFPVNFLPDGILFDTFNQSNNKRLFHEINKQIKKLNFRKVIHFCDNDVYRSFYAREFLDASIYIYYRRDNLHPIKYWSRHIKRLEPIIIQKNDIVMCNSAELAEYASPYKSTSLIFDIGQGVDLSSYRKDINYTLPIDCKHIPHPIIGYMGALTATRLDIELLYYLAEKRPQYSFLFIGQQDDTFLNHSLNTLSNVYFLGLKPMEQMPMYTNLMDVCLNPQILNEVTIGNYPRKVDEYLAMGKPVIATHTNTMKQFKDYVYLCASPKEYIEAIDDALTNPPLNIQEKRIAFAHTHSWKHCIDKIYKAIETYETTKSL